LGINVGVEESCVDATGFGEAVFPAIERPLSLCRCDARFVSVVGGFRGRLAVLWRVGHRVKRVGTGVRAGTAIAGVVDRKESHPAQSTR
jgi:hypothetical protein